MNKEEWKKRIVKACKSAGTYEKHFEDAIDTLSSIMETRDEAHRQFVESGSHPTIIHTNKAKEKNIVKNPILTMELDLNAQALAYWRDLGLTPSGLKKISSVAIDKKNDVSLEKILSKIADE